MLVFGFFYKREITYWDKKLHKKVTKMKDYYETYYNYTRDGAYNDFRKKHRNDLNDIQKLRYGRVRY